MEFNLAKIFGGAADVFSDLAPAATAQGLALALTPIAGSRPVVAVYGDYAQIEFTPEQEERVSAWLLTQLRREPGPVRVETGGIASKVITRQYWPWMLGLVVVGGAIGYSMRGRK